MKYDEENGKDKASKMNREGRLIMTISRLLQEKENYTHEISLLVSILIRYPQISSLNYDPHGEMIRFGFLISEEISTERVLGFNQLLKSSLEAFHHLDGSEDFHVEVNVQSVDKITSMEISLYISTLSRDEISLLVLLLQDAFANHLVMDIHDPTIEEEMQLQEEIIDSMLMDLQSGTHDRNFIAFREEGRVMVFNK